MPKKPRVGVFCGGISSEKEISMCSGQAVYRALKREGFPALFLDPAQKAAFRTRLKKIDLAFLALHGAGGEDGTIQKFLDRIRLPYIGSECRASELAFDKFQTKKVLIQKKILTPDFALIQKKNWQTVTRKFGNPFFVKPLREGSSIGIFSVDDYEKSWPQIEAAVRHYGSLILERTIFGPEYTVGIVGDTALPVVELRPKNEFYDYQAKYTRGMTEYIVPAPISHELEGRLRKTALRVHRALGLRDLSRIDFKRDQKTQRAYVLEANSIPGFTEFSLLPKAAQAAGISFAKLCGTLVQFAVSRSPWARKAQGNGKKK